MTATASTPQTISAHELDERRANDPKLVIVDVRTPAEFESAHISGSYNVPLNLLTEHAHDFAERWRGHVVLVCQSGGRAGQGCGVLQQVGFAEAQVLDGGIAAYQQSGGEVAGRGGRWSMERQVRCAAGVLVLAGTLAGQLVHRRLGLFAGAIGAGLTYSAVSDTCAMASALARMPWNRAAADPSLASLFTEVPGHVGIADPDGTHQG